MGAERAAAPVLSGSLPPLAVAYQFRPETGFGLTGGLQPGETVLLVPAAPGDPGSAITAGEPGGTGKTQLAAGFAHAMWSAHAIDLLVWVPGGDRTSILAGYAQAAADLELLAPGETADTGARRFLRWLLRTQRPWAVVLDGVVSPVDIDGLWPQGPAGQVVVTSQLRAAELSGPGRTAYGIGGFSKREALGYLLSQLTAYSDQRLEALDLAEDLGGLPIAMAQAAAVIVAAETTCRDYRAAYAQRMRALAGTTVDGCPQPMLGTWSLAVEQANTRPPAGLAWPALALASALDTGGIPAAVITSPAACGYVTGHPEAAAEPDLVRSAYASLQRFGLLSMDTASPARTVWLHAAVRAAARASLAPGAADQLVQAAAAALLTAWPAAGPRLAAGQEAAGRDTGEAQLSQALRDSTAALRTFAGDLLWKPEPHPLLLRAGESLTDSPALADSAIGYWRSMAAMAVHLLGHGHAQSVLARDRLTDAYASAGRLAEALGATEATLADRERTLGPHHPDTVTAQVNTARSLAAAGREPAAIPLFEQALAARERLLGPAHMATLTVRSHLAAAYSAVGRRGESIRLYERTLADAERELGPAHPETLTTRTSLAGVYLAAGQLRDAIAIYHRVLADTEQASGPDHPDALAVRAELANAHRLSGRVKESLGEYQRVLAARERVQGPDHPDTIAARVSLGYAYRTTGRVKEAIAAYERAVADTERVQGPGHRDTVTARASLAAAYQLARRSREAIAAYERAVADGERGLGPGDVDTLTARCGLATAYSAAGRVPDADLVLRRALADSERHLGLEHPMTRTVRESLRTVG